MNHPQRARKTNSSLQKKAESELGGAFGSRKLGAGHSLTTHARGAHYTPSVSIFFIDVTIFATGMYLVLILLQTLQTNLGPRDDPWDVDSGKSDPWESGKSDSTFTGSLDLNYD